MLHVVAYSQPGVSVQGQSEVLRRDCGTGSRGAVEVSGQGGDEKRWK
jgi:hypothetical protein